MTEVVVYHIYNSGREKPLPRAAPPVHKAGHPRGRRAKPRLASFFLKISIILAILGVFCLILLLGPVFLSKLANYKLSKSEVANLSRSESTANIKSYQPPYDPKLPITNRLSILSIGVDTEILEATKDNYETALRKGVWRVSDFGAPGEAGMPVILVAHKFGYLSWSNLYRRQNSFYNLTKLKVGDRVEIIYQQRKYTFEVYSEGKGSEIMDYTADLILYTCESLTGETRIFKYARLLKI